MRMYRYHGQMVSDNEKLTTENKLFLSNLRLTQLILITQPGYFETKWLSNVIPCNDSLSFSKT